MLNCLRLCLRLLLLFALAPIATVAAEDAFDAVQDQLREEFADLAGSRRVPGLAIALVVDGKTRWMESFGYADRGSRRPLTNSTRHALGDLSKPFLALLALKLAADGKLDLDAPLTRYLPQLSIGGGDPAALDLAHLLTHHAGLPANHLAGMYRDTAPGAEASPPPEALYYAQAPGLLYAYSNIGYELAARALEAAGGAPYSTLLQTQILQPLGLDATGLAPADTDVRGHRKGRAIPLTLAREQAALGLRGSLTDLAHLAERLTTPGGADAGFDPAPLFRAHNDAIALDLDYRNGLAFSLYTDTRPPVGQVARLASLYPGARGRIDIALAQRVAVIVLANGAEAGDKVDECVDRLLDAWLQARHAIAPRNRDQALPAQAPWPQQVQTDVAAAYYSTSAGLVELKPESDGFEARVLGLRLAATRRSDGWYRLHLRVFGLPLDFGFLKRVLIAPGVLDGRRILLAWTAGRRFLIGTAWEPPPLPADVRALAGRYRLLNPDRITEELGIAQLRIDLSDGVLSASYPLEIPFLRTRTPLQPDGPDHLRVPGLGSLVGERLGIERADGHVRLRYSGYLFERE